MRKFVFCALLAVTTLFCCACANRAPDENTPPDPQPGTEQVTVKPVDAAPQTAPEKEPIDSALEPYLQMLNETCDVLINGWRDENEYELVCSGVMEATQQKELGSRLGDYGYVLTDLNGDDTMELLIAGTDGLVLGGYSVVDEKAVFFLDGWSRNRYQLLKDGRFYNEGSGGAAHSCFGIFYLSDDGTKLECDDFYFTDLKSGSSNIIVPYHNTTGVWQPGKSEVFQGTEEQFAARAKKLSANAVTPNLTLFSDFIGFGYDGPINQPLDCAVRADFEEDVSGLLEDVKALEDEFPALASTELPDETRIVFRCAEDVEDFKVLRLQLLAVNEMGEPTFQITEQCDLPTFRVGEAVSALLRFPGEMPACGFSYRENGTEHRFSITLSGRDGAIVVTPFSQS